MLAGTGIVTSHAWCAHPDGTVEDPTWDEAGSAYLGIVFTPDYLAEFETRRGNITVLFDQHLDGMRLLRDGLPDTAFTNTGIPHAASYAPGQVSDVHEDGHDGGESVKDDFPFPRTTPCCLTCSMTTKWGRAATAVVAGAMVLLISSCSTITMMSEEQKVVELRRAGELGARAHVTLLTELTVPTPETCLNNLKRFTRGAPWDEPYSATADWLSLYGDYFVDSCVSGIPRVPNP